ncbi:MAG: hypothetical protein M0R73_13980 [Dehalococcoidia bacterium]|nr:hypothetical protein [Dehalococcoidia bacterium]
MTRRTTCTLAVGAVVALAPAVALANGGSGPQGTIEICHEGGTLTIPAAQWWPYGYLGATKGACPEPSATPTATPVVTPEPTPTSTPESSVTPTPYDGDYVPTGPTSGGYGIATATPTPVAAATPLPPTILQEPTPAPIAAPTPTVTPVASSTAVVPRPADTGHGDSGRSHPLRAVLIAPTVAVALLFGARTTTRERGA